ncbi:hypothetical protein SDC9_182478 [bioreactor metagenome]|uniref:Uncharacterized protein n=1 Tax=bioreactor metagenome TaxID=1076179 RepID=A0A645HFU8_9ZZZZ
MHKDFGTGHIQEKTFGDGPDNLSVFHNRHAAHNCIPPVYRPNYRFINLPGLQNIRQPGIGHNFQNVPAQHFFFLQAIGVQVGLVHGGYIAILVYNNVNHVGTLNQSFL